MRNLLILLLAFFCVSLWTDNSFAVQKTLGITQVWQHKDTNMNCVPGGSAVPHAWNDALICMHCGTYCAPASCSMYAIFTNRPAPFINQDDIYDNSKVLGGEIMGNGILETHGLGMCVGVGGNPPEIQNAFGYAVGIAPFQFGPVGTPNPLLTCSDVVWCIDMNIPILWVDMGQWPQDQETLPEEIRYESGHCKIIAGYNDNNTPGCGDDSYLIYDPWPNSGSPYWLPQGAVIDQNDIYLSITSVYGAENSSWGAVKSLDKE